MRLSYLLLLFPLWVGCTTTTTEPEADTGAATSVDESSPEVADQTEYVIDVRSDEEWASGHIEGTIHIPHTEVADRIGEVTDDKDAKIVFF